MVLIRFSSQIYISLFVFSSGLNYFLVYYLSQVCHKYLWTRDFVMLVLFLCFMCVRSSHQRCSTKKGALRNFAKFIGKHLCQSLFLNKVVGLRSATLLKRRPWHRCFPLNFAKFLRTPFLQNTSRWLLLVCKFRKYLV